ncbi:MAG: ABC transporter ATP-binding protein [Thermodesulfovibrionales bacterium]|nr:ABC transporter ATP-binding protein [Thermodesulfovibrionales bacterium]
MLEIKGLKAGYGKLEVIKNLSLTLQQGEIFSIIGPNGAGKSTLLRAITGLLQKVEGSIIFDGEEIIGKPPHVIASTGIAHVQERHRVFGSMTVRENLLMGAYLKEKRSLINENIEYVFALFPRLKERINQQAGTLSGGEQQMLTIAQALMMMPKLILLDEPSLGLAPLLISSIYDSLLQLNKKGMTILLVEQNVKKALNISKRSALLENGEIVVQGDSEELKCNEEISKVYLGIC